MFESRGDVVDPLQVVADLRERHARIAREQFTEVDAVMDLYVARCAEDARAGINEAHRGEFAHVEVASVLALTEAAARRMIGLGCELRWRLPLVRAAFAAGRIDLVKAHALAEALVHVSDEALAHIEAALLEGIEGRSSTRLRARARRLIARLDPDGVRERRRAALADRDVRISARDDGTAAVDGVVSAAGGRVLAERLRAMSYRVCASDPRSYGQRRSDALVALASGQTWLTCRCGSDACTAPSPEDPAVRVQVLVGVGAETLLGLDDRPGYLMGHGPIDADLARTLAADGTWRRILTATDRERERLRQLVTAGGGPVLGIGAALPAPTAPPQAVTEQHRARRAERTYRPGAQLAQIIRIRDGVCRFPNCPVPADSCDLDHTVPFDHENPDRGGLTVEANLACLCRSHHRLKTLGYWQVRQIGDGRLEWTDPTGRLVVTEPEGVFSDPVGEDRDHPDDRHPHEDCERGLDPTLLALLSPPRVRARLRSSTVEDELVYLCEAVISPRLTRQRSTGQRSTTQRLTTQRRRNTERTNRSAGAGGVRSGTAEPGDTAPF